MCRVPSHGCLPRWQDPEDDDVRLVFEGHLSRMQGPGGVRQLNANAARARCIQLSVQEHVRTCAVAECERCLPDPAVGTREHTYDQGGTLKVWRSHSLCGDDGCDCREV